MKPIHNMMRALIVVAAGMLGACGGGGGGGTTTTAPPVTSPTTTPPTTTPGTPAPAVTFSATSLSFSGNNLTSHVALEDESISFTIANVPTEFWFRATPSGVAVSDADFHWTAYPSYANGKLWLQVRPPATLGAGTYTGTAKFELCLDSNCAQQMTGSPMTVAVTYVVSGNALPTTQVYWVESSLTGANLTTSETRAPQMTLRLSTTDLPPGGLYLRRTPSASGLVTGAVFSQSSFSSQVGVAFGQFDVTLKPPAALGSGIFTDTMEFEACFDSACQSPVPGSRHTLAFNIFVTATAGTEFTRRTLAVSGTTPTEVVWSPANQLLYAASNYFDLDHRIIGVDPLTMATTPGAPLETAYPHGYLQHVAVTPDGSYLYVGSRSNHFVYRLQLPSLTSDLAISLGDFYASAPYLVSDFAMVPGQPQSFLLAMEANNSFAGVYAYDNATARPISVPTNPAQAFELPRWLVPAATPGTFISQSFGQSFPKVNNIDLLTLGADGISTSSSTASTNGVAIGLKPQRAGSKLYTWDGRILDAGNGALLGTLPNGAGSTAAVLPDEAHGRLFALMQLRDQKDYVLCYDLATLQLLGIASVYDTPASAGGGVARSMTLWGSDGLAIADGTRLIVLSGRFFSTYRGEPTQ